MRTTPLELFTLSLGLSLTACPADIMYDTETNSSSESSSSTGDDDDDDDTTLPTSDPTKPPTTDDTSTSLTSDPPTTTIEPSTTIGTTDVPSTTIDDTGPDTTDTDTDTTDTDSTTGGPVTTLCERLGGPTDGGIQDLVGGFLGAVLVDQRINGYFLNDDVDAGNLLQKVTAQLGAAVGCDGVVYDGLDMITAHAGLKISSNDFADFAGDFSAALDEHQAAHPDVTLADKDTILGVLGGMAADIVEDEASDATVYQRVGRKPAIQGLIGDPTLPESFVGVVATDVAINSFFAASDFTRLNTCLTRQVAGLDGPTKYGHEVDSPGPGIDEGVAADNKCRDMVSVHENLMDADMTTITIEDFLALVMDLGTAMDTAGVPPTDQDIIFGALAPLCDQIVVGAGEKNKCPGNLGNLLVEAAALGKKVADDKYTGALTAPSMTCTKLTVPDDGLGFVESVSFLFAADVTWIGDVTIKIVSPDNKVLTVLNRPTSDAPYADTGVSTGTFGYGVDLAKADKLTFKNGGATPASAMGSTLTDKFPQPGQYICKDDMKCEYSPSPTTGPGTDFTDFRGIAAVGDWQVCVGDSGPGDIITLDYLGLSFTKVKFDPVP